MSRYDDVVEIRLARTTCLHVSRDEIWDASLEGVNVEEFLDWALISTDVTLEQLSIYIINKLQERS